PGCKTLGRRSRLRSKHMAHRRRKKEKKGAQHTSHPVTRSVASFLTRPQTMSAPTASPQMESQDDSWLGPDSQPNASGLPQRNPEDDVALLDKFKTMLQHELATTAASITADISKQIQDLGHRTDVLEQKVDDITTVLDAHEQDIQDLQMQLREAMDKIEDSDNRSRRNNLRIRGLPETVTDLQAAIHDIFTSLMPNLPSERLECDRIHRALRPQREGDPPRDIILRLHYHQTQVAILQASRRKSDLEYEGHQFQIYTDLAPITLQKRKLLAPITKILQHHNVRYRWLFPVKLAFMYNNQQHQVNSVQAGSELLTQLGLMEKATGEPAHLSQLSPRRRVSPIWERASGSPRKRLT
uniref:L1 transposable element RRM domain-containing protein n=1 Tax=Xenopus tropicalis TaxID=8364 RepID=A0A803JAK4_XENTR